MARSLRRRRFSVSTFMAQVSAACSITLLTHDEYTLPLVRRGRWRLVRRGSNWRNLPHAHLQRVIAASSQPPPAQSMSLRLQNFGTTSSFSFPTSTSETSLSSIARAVPRHRAHLNSGSGLKGPLMPLHFLCTQRLQPPQKIPLELPTPDWQTPQGYFPDFFSTSRLMPDSIIFVIPMFTRRRFFSISVFHVCTITSSSSMDSALIIRSSAYSSSHGQPTWNSLDRAFNTMMKSSGLKTEPWWTPTPTPNS